MSQGHQLHQIAAGLAAQGKFLTLYSDHSDAPGEELMTVAINFARLYGAVRISWEWSHLNFEDELRIPSVLAPIREALRMHDLRKDELYLRFVERNKAKGKILFEILCLDHPDGVGRKQEKSPEGAIRA